MNYEKEGRTEEMEGPIVDVDDSLRRPKNCDECPICYQEFAYKTELPDCGHKFCFLCIKGAALRQGACPLCRKSIPCNIFLDPVLATLAGQPTTVGIATSAKSISIVAENIVSRKNAEKVKWFYGARNGGWWRYERRHESEIEEAYQHGLHSIDLLIAGSLFCINFINMFQYRKELGSKFTRPVKRIEEGDPSLDGDVRGIAGLRTPIELNTNAEQGMSEDFKVITGNLSSLDLN
ncbi:WWE domain-containing protein [Loa loa]|uniref:E3 ubiquitin-protein ligase n=2 Tax=Loa loa TaxID=7209 RepID=A0A1S0U974_LOALO|nr:WWE domain-containing protein [Loa loa]EFO26284.1 WWE domain-containing protein [Loa loa]